ncbi:MAG: transglutaminaseTgpA domain-containing protein, partial [Acidobacteriota bacterium]
MGLPRPTPLAWGLALMGLAILGAAFNTGNNLLYLLFSFLAATLPLSLVGSLLNLVRMDLRLTLPAAPQAGQPFPVRIELQSRRRRPARSLRITLFSEAGPLSEAVLERLMPGRTVQLVLPVRLVCRGPLMVKGVRLSSTFPLGLLERRRFFHREGEILVLPPPASRPARPAVANRSGGTVQSERVSGEEYQGLRQGRPEEDIRRVDWKSTARRGDLMVRETSGEAPPWKSFNLITRRDGEPAAAREAFERELAGLCGQATSILLSGGSVLLSVDGVGERIYQGPEGLASCRRRLARLEPTDSRGSLLPRLRPVPVGRPRAATESRRLPAGAAHAVSVRAALLISILALLSTGALGRVVSLALLGAVAAALFRWSLSSDSAAAADGPPGHNSKSLILWRLAGFLALAAYSTDLLFIRHNPLRASLDLIAFITVYKLFNAGGLRDDRQILLVSLLQMILTSALTTQVAFLLPLLAWILVASHAQVAWSCLARRQADTVFRWMEDESRRWLRYPGPALALTLMMTAVAGLLFVLVPHLGTGTFAPGVLSAASRSGFSMTTRLGEIGRIKQDRSRVMEIQVAGRVPPKEEIRWRGLALSHFDGHVWSGVRDGEMRWLPADGRGRFFPATGSTAMATDAAGQGASGLKAKGGDEGARRHGSRGTDAGFLQRIRLEPHEGRVLFAAATPERIQSADFVFLAQDFSGALLLPGDAGRRVSYTVLSKPLQASPDLLRLAVGPDPPVVRKIDLQLPRLDPRLVDLSRRLTEGEPTRFDAVVAIRDWLSQNLIYSLNVQDEGRENPV